MTLKSVIKGLFAAIIVLTLNSGSIYANQIDTLISDLKSADTAVVNAAIYKLAALGPAAAKAVPALIDAYHSEHAPLCGSRECTGIDLKPDIVTAFIKIGPGAAPALPLLTKIIQDNETDRSSNNLCHSALMAIAGIGKKSADKTVMVTLGELLKDNNATMKTAALLKHEDATLPHDNALEALKALVAMEEKAEPALPAVKLYLNSDFSDLQAEALKVIAKADPDKQAVTKLLTDKLTAAENTCCSAYVADIAIPYLKNRTDMSPEELKQIDRSFEALLNKGEKQGQFVKENSIVLYTDILSEHPDSVEDSTIQAMARTFKRLPASGNSTGVLNLIKLSAALGPRAKPMIPALQDKIADSFFMADGYRSAAIRAVEAIAPEKKAETIAACRKYIEESLCR
jgi:hypothetical protein